MNEPLFAWDYPLYVIAFPQRAGFAGFATGNGRQQLAVWSDEDLVRRFLKATNSADAVPLAIKSRVTLEAVFHDAMAFGADSVIVDPAGETVINGRSLPLHYFLTGAVDSQETEV